MVNNGLKLAAFWVYIGTGDTVIFAFQRLCHTYHESV